MKYIVALFSVALLVAVAFTGCEKQSDAMVGPSGPNASTLSKPVFVGDNGPTTVQDGVVPCGTGSTFDLIAGQYTDNGSVTIYNDATKLYVTVYSSNGFDPTKPENIKMWFGTTLIFDDRPAAGQLPFKVTETSDTHTFEFLLSSFALTCGTPIYVIVHADVPGATAFGGGTAGSGSAWWYYMQYTIQCCDPQPPPTGFTHNETAFAKGGYVFTTDPKSNPESLQSLRLTKNRWGWAINLPAYPVGPVVCDIWAGAGLNKTSNGVKAGALTVSWDGSQVVATYTMLPGFGMTEVHMYAGDLKPTTCAPGQYGYTESFAEIVPDPDNEGQFLVVGMPETVHTFTAPVADTNSDGIWLIAHAVAVY
jgi:hypothetical protein